MLRSQFCLLTLGLPVLLGTVALAAEESATSPQPENEVAIVSRKDQTASKQERLSKDLDAKAYQAQAVEIAKLLADKKLPESELAELTEAVKREPERAGAAFAACLNWNTYPDAATRRGALRAIQLANPSYKTVGKALGNSAFAESDSGVRKAAIQLIKDRRDSGAIQTLVSLLATSTDDTPLGKTNLADRNAALNALHDIGDKRVYQLLMQYITYDMRMGSAKEPHTPQTVYITSSGNSTTGQVGATMNLPIELPTLELISIQASIEIPAVASPMPALQRISGQNFRTLDQWRDWIAQQPDIKP